MEYLDQPSVKISGFPNHPIIEEHPEFDFVPTSVLLGKTSKKKSYGWIPISIGALLTLGGIVLLILMFYYSVKLDGVKHSYYSDYRIGRHLENHYNDLVSFMMVIGIPVASCGLITLILGLIYKKNFTPIKTIADYIPRNKRVGKCKRRMIFVKDRKFGVLKKGFNKILAPAEYDKLTWRDTNTLYAEKNKRRFLIDIYGNELT